MSKVISRKQARAIADIAIEAAQKALDEEGLDINLKGGIRYTDAYAEFKVVATLRELADDHNERLCRRVGFPENIVGRTFKHKRSTYTITGINPRRWKYPVSADNQNGKAYKFPGLMVAQKLGVTYKGR